MPPPASLELTGDRTIVAAAGRTAAGLNGGPNLFPQLIRYYIVRSPLGVSSDIAGARKHCGKAELGGTLVGMILELAALAVALTALGVATYGVASRSDRSLRKWKQSVSEELEAQEKAFKRWRGELEEDMENAKKRYRAAAKALTDSLKVRDAIDELGADGEEAGDDPEDDARGGQGPGVQRVHPSLVAGGIWQGGRTG